VRGIVFSSPLWGEDYDEGGCEKCKMKKLKTKFPPFIKPTKEARGTKAELVRHRFSDSTTGIEGDCSTQAVYVTKQGIMY